MHEIDHKVYPTPPLTYNLYMSHAKLTTITTLVIIILLLQASILPSSLFLLLSASLFKTLTMMRNGDEHHQQYSSLEVEGESSDTRNVKGKTPIMETPFIGKVVREAGHDAGSRGGAAIGRGIAIVDFVIRLIVLAALLAATISMGTTNETLPFFTQFFQFQARYYDLPSFTYFVIANAVSATYVVLSLPFSIVTIVRPSAKAPRLVLLTFDAIAAALTTSAAAAAAAIVSLAHKGNTNANWIAICQQFGNFCQRSSGSVVASFIAAFLFMLLVILSAVALKTN